jgi:hypothetical protein
MKVEILLQPGDHWVKRSHVHDFKLKQVSESHVDFRNPSFDLTIRPINCTEILS